jgi:enamine deaminase RidA (YjgF/YER057c/UK114 family)
LALSDASLNINMLPVLARAARRAPLAPARSLATLKDKEKGAEKDWANRQEAEQLKRLRESAAPAPPTSAGAGVAAALSKSPRSSASAAAAGAITRFDASPRFSGATKHRHTLYLTGQVPEESTYALGVAAQTRSVLAKVDALLKAGGSDRGRLLTASVFLTDISTFSEMNSEYVSWLAGAPAPARTTIEAKLANPGWKVEIAVIAACD